MTGHDETFSSLPWHGKVRRILAIIPGVLVVVPVTLFVFLPLGVWAVTANYLYERRIRSRMRRCGRFLRAKNAASRIAREGGTLIIESPSLGWNFTHAWWTPEDLLGNAPSSVPTELDYRQAAKNMKCLDWDKWCWENYTSPESGRAFLVRVWNGESLERKLGLQFPDLKIVRTWTALVHFSRS